MFKQLSKYIPKANFSDEMEGKSWGTIIGKGRNDDLEWVNDLEDILEMDLLDHSLAGTLIEQLKTK